MSEKIKILAIGILIGLLGLLFGYNRTEDYESRYQLASGTMIPQLFVIDTKTGNAFRYVFYFPNSTVGAEEIIRIESLGTPQNPEYKLIRELSGRARKSGEDSYSSGWGY